jgi:hypothetical protein
MPQRPWTARIAVGLVSFAISTASGAVTTFDDRSEFEAAAGLDLIEESFEDRPMGLIDLPYGTLGSGFGIDLSPADSYSTFVTDAQTFSRPSDGANHLLFAFGLGTYTPIFEMPGDSLAFGFDLSGYQDLDGSGSLEVQLYARGAMIDSVHVPVIAGIIPRFLGLRSETLFDEVRLVMEDGGDPFAGDYAGIDRLTVGVIPAPGAAMLIALGLLGSRRRRG